MENKTHKILITGVAGFIGMHVASRLLKEGYQVYGIDNLNSYYSPDLKKARLQQLGIKIDEKVQKIYTHGAFIFEKIDIAHREKIAELFTKNQFSNVIHLAAQAGVRYSITHPETYIDSNLTGFANILEGCRHAKVKHLIFASSSSIYGKNNKIPYREDQKTDSPVSLYAATKKANELMAHAYCHLYNIPTTGLRFFTVYGPWGRPDMAPYLFMDAICNNREITVFNNGDMKRDFTYIDDIVEGIWRVFIQGSDSKKNFRIYNLGHSTPVNLMDFIHIIEETTAKKAQIKYIGMQPGDVYCTYADTSKIQHDFGFKPDTDLKKGIHNFYKWLRNYEQSFNK